jgi:hypothetical protein
LGPIEEVSSEDGEIILSLKRVLITKQDGVLKQTGQWIMSRNTIVVLIYCCYKLLCLK